ncbi:MAG: hypothetical protein H6722_12525 [Sandaracinus sp.]|nr:hypothetical protein [Sandaracinus sp.]
MSDDDRLAAATRALRDEPPEDDVLAAATRAVRDEGDAPLSDVQETRRRVLLALAEKKKRRPWYTTLAFQLAAVLLTATAWAATTGRLQPLAEAVRSWVAAEERPSADDAPTRRRSSRSASVANVPSPPSEPVDGRLEPNTPETIEGPSEVTEATESAADAPTEIAIEVRASRATSRSTRSTRSTSRAPSSADLASYRAAHRAHFDEADPAAALAAWERYLEEQPRGVFRVEARYNRALSLVRLGRRAEAAEALAPFARGEVGRSYRQREAGELLEALQP